MRLTARILARDPSQKRFATSSILLPFEYILRLGLTPEWEIGAARPHQISSPTHELATLPGPTQASTTSRHQSGWLSYSTASSRRHGTTHIEQSKQCVSELVGLPLELQIAVLSQLGIGDVINLRQTCRYYRQLLTREFIEQLLGSDPKLYDGCCRTCLSHPGRDRLVQLSIPDSAWSSLCFHCYMTAPEIRDDRSVDRFADGVEFRSCQWCGWPVNTDAKIPGRPFHWGCFVRYRRTVLGFALLGWVQFGIGAAAAVMARLSYHDVAIIVAPVFCNVVLLLLELWILSLRGERSMLYLPTTLLEFIILSLWIPPIYHIAEGASSMPSQLSSSAVACLAIFSANALFRLLNLVGNLLLHFNFDTHKARLPGLSLGSKVIYAASTALVYWTYPQSIEAPKAYRRTSRYCV